jgi:hypothetical protein
MPFKGEERLITGHATSIITNTNTVVSARFQRDKDIDSSGVDGVVNELSHHRGGTLNNLTGGDLVDNYIRE